ncbi:MAG: DegT/DnrJ/EryC1/StrS family aminotransferase [Deltaproteobacteria bacterium]|nr:DegT/DnrJ/EryC1/StrS family aminotransferase [Deltaproteobacteria bacterium]
MKIPLAKPMFGEEEKQLVLEVLESGWVVQGPKVAEFERRFAAFTGAPFAVAASSCTTALHLALISLGIGPGQEVIVPAFTWIATANVVEMVGARPVFVDIDLETFNIDVRRVEKAITAKTGAIIPVSLFGLSADLHPILDLAQKHELKVVEDAACALGALYHGHPAGTMADAACFSFHPRKSITTGEGGMLTTANETVAADVRSRRDHGASANDLVRHLGARTYLLPEFNHFGYNYRMTDLQGALGVAQMGRLEWILQRRAVLAERYDAALKGIPWLRPPVVPGGYRHAYQAYVCLFQSETPCLDNVVTLNTNRNAFMDRLEAAGLSSRPGTHAVHLQGYYREKYGYNPEDFPQAYLADQLTLTLPLYAQMTEVEQDYVIECIKRG